VEWSRAAWTVFWILFTHVLIDLFTVYGTMIFEPFSDFRLGFNNLFIIDPLFTIPILVGLGVALFLPRISRSRAWWNRSGLLLATAYVLWSFVAKALVNSEFERSLEAQGVRYEQRMTAPTPFNTILWRCVARGDDGIWVGYYSLFDRGTPVHFEYYPLRSELLADLEGSRVIERLRWFSDGFLGARMEGGEVVLSDWRFGETTVPIDSMENPDPLPFFSWKIDRTSDGSLVPVQLRIPGSRSDALRSLWQRIFERDVKPGDKT
jgi:inner membrane protein